MPCHGFFYNKIWVYTGNYVGVLIFLNDFILWDRVNWLKTNIFSRTGVDYV